MNAYHQLALFIALFGGFLAWGAYEAWKNRPRTTSDVLNIIFSPRFQAEQSRKMAENRARAEYLRHIQVRDNYILAMNTQQKFNRPIGYPGELPKEISLSRMMMDLTLPSKDLEKKP